MKLHLRLLGPIRIDQIRKNPNNELKESDTRSVPRFRSRRTVALLGYLAVEQRPVTRAFLAALFWPDEISSKSRANLRRELHNLAQILPGCWVLARQSVAFVPSDETTVDLFTLSALAVEERWNEAALLIEGEFLEGLSLEDNLEFENWLMMERERLRVLATTVLLRVIESHTHNSRYDIALVHTQKLLQLTPWNEQAHQHAMRLLTWTDKRGEALRQFEKCKQALWEELGVEPVKETTDLYQQIKTGELDMPSQLPAFLTDEGARYKSERPFFVARKDELAQLARHFEAAMTGQSRVVFVTGSPGRGKTALLDTFAQQMMAQHTELLVANGQCNAYAGLGDPYLPFRDVMGMLTGDVEARWDAGVITRDHASRLWAALPSVLQTLIDHGSHLFDVLVPSTALLSRALLINETQNVDVPRLSDLVKDQGLLSRSLEQNYIFQETTDVLCTVAQERPLLLILDDIQWADTASIGLLFHLGRRLNRSNILIICAYRPEEVAFGREGTRHPLAQVLSEFKRDFGDVWIGLGPAENTEGRLFVDAFLDAEPNRLLAGFRAALLQRTQAHPLFTVELLRDMKERGDILKDEHGHWIEGSTLDWDVLPARAEAVIAERINRLDPKWQKILTIASIEGQVFTAQLVAEVQEIEERSLIRILSGELAGKHRLIKEHGEVQTRHGQMARYSFSHVLFQEYLYKRLSPGERRLLHADVATAMESLYEGELDEVVVRLGHHFHQARDYTRALPYFILAAERAAHIYANDEAVIHYTKAIELNKKVSLDAHLLAKLHHGRGLICATLGKFDSARTDFETALKMVHDRSELQLEWRLLLDLGKLWASRDYQMAQNYFESGLDLSRKMSDSALLASSLNRMGNWHANDENPVRATTLHQEALKIFQELGDQQGQAITLDLLGIANLLGGNLNSSVAYYNQAIAIFQELDNQPRLLSSLMGRGTTVSLLVLLATMPATPPPDALHDIQKAIQIAQETHAPTEEVWAHWTLGLLHTVHGQFGLALEVMQSGLYMASEIGHGEWVVGNQFALGVLYCELLAPKEARKQLEQALDRAQELRSQYWINHVSGALAKAYLLLENPQKAQTCLENALSPQTAMDTMGKRYCWTRRAELALFQNDPVQALDIVDQLIASAPSLSPHCVITFLWKLKGDALTMMGRVDEAKPLLHAALDNAQAQGEKFLLWETQVSIYQLYHTMNCQNEAQQACSTAHELIKEMADTLQDKVLQDDFLQHAQAMLSFP